MLLVFQAIFSWANLPMNLIDHVFSALAEAVRTNFPAGSLPTCWPMESSPGVGGVLAFLPQILLLFLFISILEDSGYMARAAFLMDRLMRGVGLHGKAFVPLLSSFACAVPGIMATRTIENPKDRIATIMIAPFMSCSARLPVYTLMIAAFFSGQKVFGFISLGAVNHSGDVPAGNCGGDCRRLDFEAHDPECAAAAVCDGVAAVSSSEFRQCRHALLTRSSVFIKRAGTVILAISILLWALVAFPRAGSSPAKSTDHQYSRVESPSQTDTRKRANPK